MKKGKRYYVFSWDMLDSISHHCFENDMEAVKWFMCNYGKGNGLSLHRFDPYPMINAFKDKRLA